jgi:hypothetical protein
VPVARLPPQREDRKGAVFLRAGIGSGGRAIAADFGPAGYQLPVGSGVDAELSGLQVGGLILWGSITRSGLAWAVLRTEIVAE